MYLHVYIYMYKLSLNVYWSLMKNIGTHCLIFKACIYRKRRCKIQ